MPLTFIGFKTGSVLSQNSVCSKRRYKMKIYGFLIFLTTSNENEMLTFWVFYSLTCVAVALDFNTHTPGDKLIASLKVVSPRGGKGKSRFGKS